ncbi:MAG: NADH-quinone oxidoreductase subunit N [Dehalococcoidia bacterium]|nr:NADH-quinone oxidoreductase subunit N [Dehalococcoidia bacterium]
MDLLALRELLPELILIATGLVVILVDLVTNDKRVLPIVSAVGVLLSIVFTVTGLSALLRSPFVVEVYSVPGAVSADALAYMFRLLLSASTLAVIGASSDYVQRRLIGARGEFYALLLFAAAAMMILTAATELITAYVALETSGIALYALSGFLRDRRSSEAGIKFLVLGGVSSAFLLYGMVILFGLTGTTSYAGIAPALHAAFRENALPISLAVVLIVAGFGFKLAAFPFQMWVPDVYEGAPTPVTMFLSVVSKAAGFGVALRIFHLALGAPPVALEWTYIFAALAALTMTLGNLAALRQHNIKRLMGYSSVAQAGYLMAALAVPNDTGTAAVTFFLISYAVTNLAAFAAIIALTEGLASEAISDLAGAAQRSPFLAFCFTIALLSLTGIPPTAGFFAKLTVFGVAVNQGLLWLVLVGVVNSVISAYYYMAIVKAMYVGSAKDERTIPAGLALTTVLVCTTALTVLLGIAPDAVVSAASTAAAWLP